MQIPHEAVLLRIFIGVGILQDAKALVGEGISPLGLFLGALRPTAVAISFVWLLR